ncbi:hypothetical protein O1R50_06780 [Glycomyces luteolus]|uniref:Uncharacterized protein n=1 Tax=Glycomyces luteolus TaxID=2670330 RepID=A0A9X3P9B8_9ACTN|nr:hypothetical protein [Glycomyces luteolus]MDA1359318.1 hypothetical protein [Glycomyces luteolus]
MYQPQPTPQQPPEPAPRKPGTVRLIQILMPLIALCLCALPLFFLNMTAEVIERNREVVETFGDSGMEDVDLSATPMEYATSELIVEFSVAMALVGAAVLMAPLSVVGLQKRRRWARILTAVWTGIVMLPFGFWAVWAVASKLFNDELLLVEDYHVGPIDPVTLGIGAASLAFVSTLLVFILVLTRGTRRWAPKRSAAPTASQAPAAPAQFGGAPGFAPQQPGPYGQQQGYQPPQQQFPPQQPPYGGGR